MILSSADILRVLGGDPVIRQEARLSIVDGRPGIGIDEYVYIYIDEYPTTDEFEATWKIWVIDGGSSVLDLVLDAMKRLLPNFEISGSEATTRDFLSEKTVLRPAPDPIEQATRQIDKRFEGLSEDIMDRMLLVRSGKDGRDGRDGEQGPQGPRGQRGPAGKDGRDLVATDANLFDLNDVEGGITLEKGQVLTWDGTKWTNLYVPRSLSSGGGGGASTATNGGLPPAHVQWKYHIGETGEPTSKEFHSDTALAENITYFHVSNINHSNSNVEELVKALIPVSSKVYISNVNDPSQAHLYFLNGTFVETANGIQFPVSHIDTPGAETSFVNNAIYDFSFISAAVAGGGIPEAPNDGNYYVRQNGQWVSLFDIIGNFGGSVYDGGNFTTGNVNNTSSILDGGNFSA